MEVSSIATLLAGPGGAMVLLALVLWMAWKLATKAARPCAVVVQVTVRPAGMEDALYVTALDFAFDRLYEKPDLLSQVR